MDNISFGQYVPGNSWIYKLDPRLKIIFSNFVTLPEVTEKLRMQYAVQWKLQQKIQIKYGQNF